MLFEYRDRRHRGWLVAATPLALAAMPSQSIAVTLPFGLILLAMVSRRPAACRLSPGSWEPRRPRRSPEPSARPAREGGVPAGSTVNDAGRGVSLAEVGR